MAMKFLQMTPENIAQANNLSWKDAWNLDKKYSYNPNYKGKGATGLGGYVKQGLGSLFGGGQTTGGVGGATPLTRKVALSPFGRVAGAAFGPLGWGAAAGQGLGMAADQYAQATNTPEAYEYMKSMGGVNSLGNFDETNLDVGDIYSEMDRLNQPQTLGFRSMVDMNNDAQNFDSQFVSPDRFNNMGQMGPVKSNAPAALDMDRIPGRIQESVEPQYRMRNQLARDFLQGGLFRDAKNSLRETGTALNKDFGDIKGKIGAGFNNLIDNPVTRGLGTAFNFAKGNVPGMLMSGLGSIINRDPNAPSYQQYSPQSYLKDNNLKNIYNANPSMINDFYDDNPDSKTYGTTRFDRAVPGSFGSFRTLSGYLNRDKVASKAAREQHNRAKQAAKAQEISLAAAKAQQAAIGRENASYSNQGGGANQAGSGYSSGSGYNQGNYCFDPSTPIQMADGSTKKIKNIQLGDNTKGGEVTGVFQFKATDEIHDYKGVTVAGSHYVKEDGRFIMVKDSPLSVKIDKIPVVYSLDTSGRRIFINDIEFADYNGDGVAKNFLSNAGADLTGFDKEVLRQVEQRLI